MTIIILLVVLTITAIVNIVIVLTKKSANNHDVLDKLTKLDAHIEHIDPLIRDEFGRTRNDNQVSFRDNREELNNAFKLLGETLSKTVTDLSNAQKNQFDTFSQHLNNLAKTVDEKIKSLIEQTETTAKGNRSELNNSFKLLGDNLTKTVTDFSNVQKNQFESYSNRLSELTKSFDDKTKTLQEQLEKSAKESRTEQTDSLKSFEEKLEAKLKEVRETIENKLTNIQEDNNKKLEEMRKTVDEKLQESINKRFNESFELISKRLEEVQKGLGEMQTLASDVGGLKKVLTNVKTRGTFGEVQLESLLEQIFSPEQYETQVSVRKNSQERVDAAVKLPGQTDDNTALLLPIDSKFPVEDYQRLYDAYEAGESKDTILNFRKRFEDSVKSTAKSIATKYINPPETTDFAIMFVPSEGIYAEILRSVELFETLRRNFRITIVGPTNLAAFLSSLQMGFRTLAIQKRTSEVWTILGAVKTEFGKFGDVLDKASNQLQTVAKSISSASVKTRTIERKLRGVESLPQEQATVLLGEIVEFEQDNTVLENSDNE